MPQRIKMVISNGNHFQPIQQQQTNGTATHLAAPKAPSALNAPFIARIQNVRPGCGSCGRH
jgi:hypothetical protein